MRELKFRAWDKSKSAMMLQDRRTLAFYERDDEWEEMTPIQIVFYDESQDYIILQYIGLKDCNGTDIYEGDIVRFNECKPRAVVFQTDGVQTFYFEGTELWLSSYDCDNYEVIGNVYENKEILEKGAE